MEPRGRAQGGPPAGNAAATAGGARTRNRPADNPGRWACPGRGERPRPRKGGKRARGPAELAYSRDRARQMARGTWQPWADPAQVRDHIARLLQTGTFQAVGRAARVGEMTVWEIAHGARPAIKQETAAALLAV